MTEEEFKALQPGDLIRHASAGSPTVLVTAHYGSRVTAVRTYDVTNPIEWVVSRTGWPSRPSPHSSGGKE